MWGKLQTTGYGTALKVLFELKDRESMDVDLSNIELIALVNTFDRLSKSVESINNFKRLYEEAYRKEELGETEESTINTTFDFNPNNEVVRSVETKKEGKKNLVKTPDLFKKEAEIYEDVIFPDISRSEDNGLFLEIFVEELKAVLKTALWVLKSYYIFPKIIYNWCLIRIVYYWNTFIGHVNEDFDFDRLYTINI